MTRRAHGDGDVEGFDARRGALIDLVTWMRPRLAGGETCRVTIVDPGAHPGAWPGWASHDGRVHRGWSAWTDLADHMAARLTVVDRTDDGWFVCFTPLGREADVHDDRTLDKYDAGGTFASIRKFEHPGFLCPFLEALSFAAPDNVPAGRALVVGCHQGDEIGVLAASLPNAPSWELVGLDLSASALDVARARFPEASFVRGDARDLPVDLGSFDLIVAVDLVQSPTVDLVPTLRHWRERLTVPSAGLIVGLPCSRLQDGEIRFGSRTRNFAEVDLSLLVRDAATIRRSLHQHGFRTRMSGRYDLLISARRGATTTTAKGA